MQATKAEYRSKELQRLLGIADNFRTVVESIKGDKELKSDLESDVPQIVVIGMQSAGKSSTLELLSGVKFPRAEKLCTRLRIELKLKRGPEVPTTVVLKGPEDFFEAFNSGDITKDIKDAQDRAVEVSGQMIMKDYIVEISCQNPTVVNVTLVDLPGFFAPKVPELITVCNTVKELGESYAKMKNSLVLHVMGIDQDYGNLSTKLTINDLDQNKVINVFTMADLLYNQGKEKAMVRLEDYLRETEYPRFVVYGECNGTNDEEVQFIRNLEIFNDNRLAIGVGALGEYLENRIGDHIAAIIPELKQKLQRELKMATEWLTANAEKRPEEVVQKLGINMQLKWPYSEHEQKMRLLSERMRVKFRNCRIRPLQTSDSPDIPVREVRCNELQCGDEVFIEKDDNGDQSTTTSSQATGVKGSRYVSKIVGLCERENVHFTDGSIADLSQIYVPDLQELLLEEVLTIMEERPLMNLPFYPAQIVLEKYIANFAVRYGDILTQSAMEAHEIALQSLRTMFNDLETHPSGLKVKQALLEETEAEFECLKVNALKVMERMVAWCQPPLVYTTNEHYLLQNVREAEKQSKLDDPLAMLRSLQAKGTTSVQDIKTLITVLEASPAAPTDVEVLRDAAIKTIRCLEAFWKVKVKAITEAAASELGLIFCKESRECLRRVGDRAQQYVHLVKETNAMISERKKHRERERVLREAIALF
jgi:GTP-binding protein EngB required for normal cell division